jgi:hypothetical protein
VVLAAGAAELRNRFDDQHWPLATTPAFAHWPPSSPTPRQDPRRPAPHLRAVTDDYWESAPPASPITGAASTSPTSAPPPTSPPSPVRRVAAIAGSAGLAAPGPSIRRAGRRRRGDLHPTRPPTRSRSGPRLARAVPAIAPPPPASPPTRVGLALQLAYRYSDRRQRHAVQEHRARGAHAAVLHHATRSLPAARPRLVAGRRRRVVPGLRQRHHLHLVRGDGAATLFGALISGPIGAAAGAR